MPNNKDSLFLLEALVEKIKFLEAPCFSDGAFQTCVKISAPHVEPLEICDDDSGLATGGTPFVKTFNSGKSCLFFLKEADIKSAMSRFVVDVEVFKKLPCGCLPAHIQLGKASIDMTKEFVQARNLHLQSPGTAGFQALQDTFRVIGEDKSDTAEIVLFLRISCFGGLIVTKFQGASGPITLGARAEETDRSCNPKKPYQTEDDPCLCGVHATGKKPLMGNTLVCRGGGTKVCPPAQDPYNVIPCAGPDDACYCTGPHPVVQTPLACRNINPYCLHIPKGRSKQYEEIGTNLAGNELKIKVPVCSAIIKKISQTHCAIQRPYDKENKKKVVGKNDAPCEAPCGKNQISLALPSEAVCCRGPQLADTQFTCTTEGCLQGGKHGQARSEVVQQEPPNKDVFVLKVAKTAMQGDRKCKLELELVAPKAGNKRLPIKKINTKMQSNECECCKNAPRRRPRS
ncbi:hypothetical protein NE865_15422 [Phthorimaea operculella]|nr:hypothetical protein NE865_15422 [Phthorimaea operculella]